MMKRLLAAGFVLALSCLSAAAQSCWPDPNGTRCNAGAPVMYLNGSSQAIPVDATHGLPVNIVANSGAAALVGITPTDRTVTSATGSSQTMMAANAARHQLTIVNTGNANCGVNPTGGTAAIGGAGTITLSPLGAYTPRIPTLSAVTVICTAAQPIYGDES